MTDMCPHEFEVLNGFKQGTIAPELSRHVEDCAACRQALAAAEYLMYVAESDAQAIQVPTAGFVWWRAEIESARAAASRCTTPISLVQKFTLLLLVVAPLVTLALLYSNAQVLATGSVLTLCLLAAVIYEWRVSGS